MEDDEVSRKHQLIFEQLVQIISGSSSSQDQSRRKAAEDELQLLADNENHWKLFCDCLFSESQATSFHAARILKHAISNGHFKSSEFVAAGRHKILDALIHAFSFHSKRLSQVIVTNAITSALVQFFLQPHFKWDLPIRCLLVATYVLDAGPTNDPPGTAFSWGSSVKYQPLQILPICYFIQDLTEEVLQTGHLGQLGALRISRLLSQVRDAWLHVHAILNSFHTRAGSSDLYLDPECDIFVSARDEDILRAARLAVSTARPLLIFTKQENLDFQEDIRGILSPSLRLIFESFVILQGDVIDTLTTIIEEAPRMLKLVPTTQLPKLFISPQVGSIRESLKEGNFSPENIRFGDMVVAFAKNLSFDNIMFTSTDGWHSVYPILYDLISCGGVTNIEDTVCSPALEVWVDIADGLDQWADADAASNFARSHLSVAVRRLMTKARYPIEELRISTSSWDESERIDFEAFRRDFEDFILSCYSSLGSTMLQDLKDNLFLNLQTFQWQEVEVIISGLTSFAIVRGDKEDLMQCIDEILMWRSWSVLCTSDVLQLPGKVVKAAVRLIAELGSYFKMNHTNLSENIGLVIRSLSHPECSSEAATALQKLCLMLRDILATRFEELFETLWQYLLPGTPVRMEQKQKIFGAIATIIQALPSEEMKFQSLVHIVTSMDTDILQMFELQQSDADAASIPAARVTETLAEIANGLQPPQTIDSRPEDFNEINAFWAQEGPIDLQRRLFAHVYQTAWAFSTNSEVIDACCAIIRAGHTLWPRTVFTMTSLENRKFLLLLIRQNIPNIDAVLRTASSFLRLYSNALVDIQPDFISIVSKISEEQQEILQCQAESDAQDFSVATLEFYIETLPRFAPLLFSVCSDVDVESLLSFAFACLDGEDTLPRRSAASFWSTLFNATGQPSPIIFPTFAPSGAEERLTSILRLTGERFAKSIFRQLAGKCPRSEISVLCGPLKAFVSGHGMLAGRLLQAAARDADNVTGAVADLVTVSKRERFVESVLRLRGGRTTNEVARQFWHDCRGKAFQYTA